VWGGQGTIDGDGVDEYGAIVGCPFWFGGDQISVRRVWGRPALPAGPGRGAVPTRYPMPWWLVMIETVGPWRRNEAQAIARFPRGLVWSQLSVDRARRSNLAVCLRSRDDIQAPGARKSDTRSRKSSRHSHSKSPAQVSIRSPSLCRNDRHLPRMVYGTSARPLRSAVGISAENLGQMGTRRAATPIRTGRLQWWSDTRELSCAKTFG